MLAKADLIHGAYYFGSCRNASVARWDAERKVFWYRRHKFNDTFIESIRHPEDDDGFDLFTPREIVSWGVEAIPLGEEADG